MLPKEVHKSERPVAPAERVSARVTSTTPTSAPETVTPSGIESLGGKEFGKSVRAPDALKHLPLEGDNGKTTALDAGGRDIAGMLFKSSSAALQSKWADYVSGLGATQSGKKIDVDTLVQSVLREAYSSNTEDLRFYAEKVKFYNDLKDQIRDELKNARDLMAKTAGRGDQEKLKDIPGVGADVPKLDVDGTYYGAEANAKAPLQDSGTKATTKGELDAYIKGLEEKLNSVGDDAQLANVDLQNMLQKQQQTLQMMSNISKMLHDTALAVIRKIGA